MKFNLADYKKYSGVLIETGSCYGDGINKAITAGYQKIKSVELLDTLHFHCVGMFKDNPAVELYLGRSVDRLPDMLNDEGRCVFFLDAHPAGPGTAGHEEILRDGPGSEFDQDTIIKQELEIILAHRHDHIILIDDCKGESYVTLVYKQMMPGYSFKFYDADGWRDKILCCTI